MSGHSVLQLPVAPLEEWVRDRTRHYDSGFVSADPRFAHAHITALGPFDPCPEESVMARIEEIVAVTPPLPIELAEVAQFPNGIIHLRPDPDAELRALTDRLAEAFPDFVPYGGRFGPRVDPHLTLDAASETVSIESTRRLLGGLVPVSCTLTTLQLAWWESGACHVMAEWELAASPPAGSAWQDQRHG